MVAEEAVKPGRICRRQQPETDLPTLPMNTPLAAGARAAGSHCRPAGTHDAAAAGQGRPGGAEEAAPMYFAT